MITQHVSQPSKGSVLDIWFISEQNNGFASTLNVLQHSTDIITPWLVLDRQNVQITIE